MMESHIQVPEFFNSESHVKTLQLKELASQAEDLQCTQADTTYLDTDSTLVHGMHRMETIQRLKTINNMLQDVQTFNASARELLEWCSDSRAFTATFEPHLMTCLTTLRQVAEKPSFDVELSYRVITICSSHSDDFSAPNASLLTQWSEELGKVLLLKLKSQDQPHSEEGSQIYNKGVPENTSHSVYSTSTVPQQLSGMQKSTLHKQYSGDVNPMGWQHAGPPSAIDGGAGRHAPSGQPGIQVVTTVWEMTPGSQMPGSQHTAGYTEAMYQRGASMRPQAAAYPQHHPQHPQPQSQQPATYARQTSMPSAAGSTPHYRPYNGPPNGNPDYQPPPGALSAAAMAAAAATATATATATASMIVQDPHNPYHHQPTGPSPNTSQIPPPYNMPYSGGVHRMGSPINPMAGGPMAAQTAYRRSSPYGDTRQMMLQRKQPFATAPSSGMAPSQHHPYNVANAMPQSTPHYSNQAHFPTNGRVVPNMVTRGSGHMGVRAPPPYGSGHQYVGPVSRGLPPAQPGQQGQPGQQYPMMSMSAVQDVKPAVAQTPTTNGGELQLTFPVRDGVILAPFKLQHNVAVTQHVFHLKDHIFQTLMEKPDLELQLKCYHHDDRNCSPNWPASVSVSVNNRPLLIERGEHQRSYHKPLYLKSVCMPGNNTISIHVYECCCSHLFFLQVVHRPTVQSVRKALLQKNLLPSEQCVNKIKRNFSNVNGCGGETDGVEQMSVKISMKCPITFRRIVLPARGSNCCHIQCFDLEAYLQINCERGSWRCPVCNKAAPLESLEIDQYMWGIADQLNKSEAEEINIEANASWKPNKPLVKKEEADTKAEVCNTGGNSLWSQVYSPASTNMPSAGTFEGHHNPMSPYPTPPNSHNSQGGNSIAHYNTGLYDVGFNSPPEFTGPMSNRSDISENDKQRMALLQRQQSGISSPQGNGVVNSSNPYAGMNGGPGSNTPAAAAGLQQSGPGSVASARPPSTAAPSQGPPSNAPPSIGPPSNAPASNHSTSQSAHTAELTADLSELVNNNSNDNPLDGLDDQDLLAYLGPQDSSEANDGTTVSSQTNAFDDDDILALFA